MIAHYVRYNDGIYICKGFPTNIFENTDYKKHLFKKTGFNNMLSNAWLPILAMNTSIKLTTSSFELIMYDIKKMEK